MAQDPLHGVTLQALLETLVEAYGFEELAHRVPLHCFQNNPSVASSLKFLRRTPWAREKVESFYLFHLRELRREAQREQQTARQRATAPTKTTTVSTAPETTFEGDDGPSEDNAERNS